MVLNKRYKFFEHKKCEYFPCHKRLKEHSCIFCFCPLYDYNCIGNFRITSQGIKDCFKCTYPHKRKNYDKIMKRLKDEYSFTKK